VTIKHDAEPKGEDDEKESGPQTFTMSAGSQSRSGLSMKKSESTTWATPASTP
jgi:hypothetical protein